MNSTVLDNVDGDTSEGRLTVTNQPEGGGGWKGGGWGWGMEGRDGREGDGREGSGREGGGGVERGRGARNSSATLVRTYSINRGPLSVRWCTALTITPRYVLTEAPSKLRHLALAAVLWHYSSPKTVQFRAAP